MRRIHFDCSGPDWTVFLSVPFSQCWFDSMSIMSTLVIDHTITQEYDSLFFSLPLSASEFLLSFDLMAFFPAGSNLLSLLVSAVILYSFQENVLHRRFIQANPNLIFSSPTAFSVSLSISVSSATIRNAILLLLVATSTWLCGLMAVNNSILAFYYIFNVLCLVQVWT